MKETETEVAAERAVESALARPFGTRADGGLAGVRLPGHIPQLDGLRGLAIIAVLFCHVHDDMFSKALWLFTDMGWMGVDLFFVLSGFLITRILLGSRGSENYFSSFYKRRILRIWPLYYTVLGVLWLVMPRINPSYRGAVWVPTALFAINLVQDWSYPQLSLFWSLAVEEQFYLVWPLMVRFLRLERLKYLLYAVVALSPVLRFYAVFARGTDIHAIYTHTAFRLDGLAWGGLVAMWVQAGVREEKLRRFARWAVGFGLPATMFLAGLHTLTGQQWEMEQKWVLMFSTVALWFAGMVVYALLASLRGAGRLADARKVNDEWYGRGLRTGVLQLFGKVSFGLYMVHTAVFSLCVVMFARPGASAVLHSMPIGVRTLVVVATKWGLSLLVACASWRYLEEPILRLKDKWAPVVKSGGARKVAATTRDQ